MLLTQENHHQLAEEGYLHIPNVFTGDQIAQLHSEVDDLHRSMQQEPHPDAHITWEEHLDASAEPKIRQLLNSELVCPELERMLSPDSPLIGIMGQLLGPEMMLFHSKLMMKSAQDGSITPWHQDWGYWQYHHINPSQYNAMLAIDAADEANGCIRFVPGSHKAGPIDHKDFGTREFNKGLEGSITDRENRAIRMEPGDIVIFGALIIHGSAPNTSDRHRRANTFAFDKVGNHRSDNQSSDSRRRIQVAEGLLNP